MPQYLVELYTPTPRWLQLPAAQRAQFLAAVREGMAQLAGLGIAPLALGAAETGIAQASAHRFLGIWRCADAAARDALLAGIQASGWYEFFDHVNASSPGGDLEGHLLELAQA
ncbi:MAG TPA: DUF6616 family protein [Pseudorhodoferax sp.]|jgi:hypothetical protein|nr:DUF6616 family protein [Pseudorhodoferax sp.]